MSSIQVPKYGQTAWQDAKLVFGQFFCPNCPISWYVKYLHTIVLGWPRSKLVEVASHTRHTAPPPPLWTWWPPGSEPVFPVAHQESSTMCVVYIVDPQLYLLHLMCLLKYWKQSLLSSFDLFRCQFFQCGLLMLSLTSRSGVIANILSRRIPLKYSAGELEHQPNEEGW